MKINMLFLTLASLIFVGATAKPGGRIIGGTAALAGQFKYAAAIQVETPTGRHFCGGALADSQFVMTSAHCIYNATLFTIRLGSNTLTDDDPNRVTVATSEYYIHPDFDPEKFDADIGLIKLRMNVTYTDYLKGASLLIDDVREGDEVRIIGWGQTSDTDAELSEHLQYVDATVLPTVECQAIYGTQITGAMVCLVGNYNEGTCTGDNGGPLLRYFANGYYMVGVSSFISANGCESTNPSGYTKIAPYYLWIRLIMNGH